MTACQPVIAPGARLVPGSFVVGSARFATVGRLEAVYAKVNLAGTECNARPQLLDGIVESELDRAMVLYPRQFGPRCAFARMHRTHHELGSRISQHLRELGVRYGRYYGDVARVLLGQDGAELCNVRWKDAHFGEEVHSVQHFVARE